MSFSTPITELIERNSNGLLGKHESWERVRLGDVVTVQNGAAFRSEHFNSGGQGVPLLRIRDVVRGATDTWYDGPYEAEYVVQPGDLVIGMDGDFNHSLWSGSPALLNQRVCRLIFDSDKILKRFVLYALGGYLQATNDSTSSVTVKHLSSRTVADLLLPLPPLPEQRRIAEALESQMTFLARGVADLRGALAKLPRHAESVLAAAVSGRLVPNDFADAAGSELLSEALTQRQVRWQREGLGRYSDPSPPTRPPADVKLPLGWTWASVDKLSIGVQYGSSAKASPDGPGVPVLRMGNIVEGSLSFSKLKYLPADHSEFPGLLLRDGDILFNRTNSPELVGKAAVARGLPDPCSFASYLIRVRVIPELEPEFLTYYLNSAYGRAWVRENVTQQVGQANINGSKLRALTIPLPPRSVQRRIRDEVERIFSTSGALRGSLEVADVQSASLTRSLLREAFSGRLVPQDPSDEPASALLARVKAERSEREDERRAERPKRRGKQQKKRGLVRMES